MQKNISKINQEKANQKRIKRIQKQKRSFYKKKQKELKKLQKAEIKKERQRLKKRINQKEIKKIRAYKSMIKAVSIFIAIIILLILLILSPVFSIKDVQVTGNKNLTENTILSLANIEPDTNIFKVTSKSLKEKIKENAYVNNVTIKKVYPSTIIIKITEREVNYLLEYSSAYAYIDNQGYILEISKEKIDNKIKISGYVTSIESIIPGNRLCQEDLQKLNVISQINNISNNIGIQNLITSINIEKNNYSLYLESEGKKVELGDNSNLETKLLYVKEIVERTKGEEGVIHVNVNLNEKRAYFTKNT